MMEQKHRPEDSAGSSAQLLPISDSPVALTNAMEDAGHSPSRKPFLWPQGQELADITANMVLPVLKLWEDGMCSPLSPHHICHIKSLTKQPKKL